MCPRDFAILRAYESMRGEPEPSREQGRERHRSEPAPRGVRPASVPAAHDVAAYLAKDVPPGDGDPRARVAAARWRVGLPVTDEIVDDVLRHAEGLFVAGRPTYTEAEEQEMRTYDARLRRDVAAIVEPQHLAEVRLIWLGGRRGVEVGVTFADDYQQRLAQAVGAERVRVVKSEVAIAAALEIQEAVGNDLARLGDAGVDVELVDGERIEYFAADEATSAALLRDRYGQGANPVWLGPDRDVMGPQPFGSWTADGSQLTVFFPVEGEGVPVILCEARELDQCVIVTVTSSLPAEGPRWLPSFRPWQATLRLKTSVGDRAVLDGIANAPRPRWAGPVGGTGG